MPLLRDWLHTAARKLHLTAGIVDAREPPCIFEEAHRLIDGIKRAEHPLEYAAALRFLLHVAARLDQHAWANLATSLTAVPWLTARDWATFVSGLVDHVAALDQGPFAFAPLEPLPLDTLVTRTVALIEHEYDRDLAIAAIVLRLPTTRRTLERRFGDVMQTSIGDYTSHVRLREALHLLRTPSLKVDAVARAVGLSRSYLHALVLQTTGLTPAQVRQHARIALPEARGLQFSGTDAA